MSDWYEDNKACAQERRRRLEPHRMNSTREALVKLGCKVEPGPDGFRSYRVIFPNGCRFVFWPYSGWFQGKTQGRGFENLVKAGTEER
ncbi:MAG: hypothetical protein ACRD1X_12480 [Vicinamibacteria bacterium]